MKRINIFKELDKGSVEITKQKRKKKYRMGILNGLYKNGHFPTIGRALATYEIIGDKCTTPITIQGQTWYLVYGGKYSKIVSELCENLRRCRNSIKKDLVHLQNKGYIQFNSNPLGTRIAVKKIEGAFERAFTSEQGLLKSYKGGAQELSKHTQELNKSSVNRQSLTKTLTRRNTKTTTDSNIADDIYSLFEKNKTPISKDRIEKTMATNLNEEPYFALARAKLSIKDGIGNPPGYWITLMKDKSAVECPWNDYHTSFPFAYVTEEVRKLAYQTLGNKWDEILTEIAYQVNPSYEDPTNLTTDQKQKMLEITQKLVQEVKGRV